MEKCRDLYDPKIIQVFGDKFGIIEAHNIARGMLFQPIPPPSLKMVSNNLEWW